MRRSLQDGSLIHSRIRVAGRRERKSTALIFAIAIIQRCSIIVVENRVVGSTMPLLS